jgi:hypothetical protein
MSTFNNKINTNNNNNNSGLIINKNTTNIISNSTNTSSSPLTPRQIKQRNSAKRNSIPRSVSSNPQQLQLQNTKQQQILNSLAPQQQRDLLFLQTQKFETEFLQTTRDLFCRYPNAKISISVLIASQNTSRQIEIDRTMFEFLCTFQNIRLQPETPIRTTSIQNNIDNINNSTPISTNLANNVNNTSISSTSPSSSSTSSYDTNENTKNEKSDELSEAIKKAAAEHFFKRQMSAQLKNDVCVANNNSKKETRSYSIQSNTTVNGSYKYNENNTSIPNVKSELERAIENRLKKTNLAIQQQEKLEIEEKKKKEINEQKISNTKVFFESSSHNSQEISAAAAAIEAAKLDNLNKRNVPRDPPPSLPPSALIQMSKSNINESLTDILPKNKSDQIIPPAPPLPSNYISNSAVNQSTSSTQLSNNSTTSFPPPPSPTQLHRLSKSSTTNINLNRSVATPPPPPPPPPPQDFFSTKSNNPSTNIVSNSKIEPNPKPLAQAKLINSIPSTSINGNVKSIINIYQQSQIISDPRCSSDFGELIAKKAAEKRAKFQDVKPSSPNAVTFQPDGSKVYSKVYKTHLNLQNNNNNHNSQSNKLSEKVYHSTDALIINSVNGDNNISNNRDFVTSYSSNINGKNKNKVDTLLISNQIVSVNSNNNGKFLTSFFHLLLQ